MKIIKYPDGSSYVQSSVQDSHITFRINTYEDLWHLTQLVDAYTNQYNRYPTVIIPNLIDAQADRRFNNYESSGLKLVCKHLNSLKVDFKIFHPHNPEVVEALMDNVEILDNREFIYKVLENIPGLLVEDKLVMMSTDAGGFKSLMKLCDKIKWNGDVVSASKSRYFDKTQNKSILTQILPIEDFKGKDILIIDDICVYGGTFIGLSKLLRERNIGNLYLAVSHMTVENFKSSELFDSFDKVFTTNSKYDSYFVPDRKGESIQPSNLEIIKLFK